MSRWFRVYDNLVEDPKVQRLPDSLFRGLVNLWCLASQGDGLLPTVGDIAFKLRIKPAQAQKLLGELRNAGLIVDDETGTHPHNWNGRQFKSDVSNERVKRHRERKCNVTETVTVAVPETETETETEQKTDSETEQKDKTARAVADDWPKDFGDLFWQAYPRKTEKLSAMKRLSSLRKSGIVTFQDLMAGVSRYAAAVSNSDPRFTKHPTTWLNAGCWADETQPGGGNGTRNFNPQRGSASSDFFAGMRGLAADIAGDHQPSGDAAEEIPVGRVNIEH